MTEDSSNKKELDDTLNQLFKEALKIHNDVMNTTLDTASEDLQHEIQKGVLMLEDATRIVSMLDLFSSNEIIQEVPEASLKFFLLPVLLGNLNLLITEFDRRKAIEISEVYFIDFLKRCKSYEISEFVVPKIIEDSEELKENEPIFGGGPPTPAELAKMNAEREAKIRKFREQKELEKTVNELQEKVDHEDCDVDIVRTYYISLIKKFINSSLESLDSINLEKKMLAYRKKFSEEAETSSKIMAKKEHRPLQPIIITRDSIQKSVYGLGYPSLPVLSIEEFYDQRVKDGWFSAIGGNGSESLMDKASKSHDDVEKSEDAKDIEREMKIENDDEGELQKQRDWDEWKDTHRTGWGNKKNMG